MTSVSLSEYSPTEYLALDYDGDRWLFDLTFLTSNWTCIFRAGCLGVHEHPTPELGHGCCSFGAHFTDEDDLMRVAEAASRLTDDQWQFRGLAQRRGGPFKRQDGATVSRLVDGACIFLNRPGARQGHGCALHIGALQNGERPLDWKPEVCWQLPLRLTFHEDENGRRTHTLRVWDRADWGEGGSDFHWWCTDSHQAFVGGRPVYLEMRDEIVELIGAEIYQVLVAAIEARAAGTPVASPRLKPKA